MCGITGFFGKGDQEILKKMTDTLIHRGPDNEGYFFDPVASIGLGQRRLSIIDVAGGKQPIFNEDKTIAVVFNGEIYNFLELRRDLEKRHRFVTQTDTEVIAHLYEEKRENCIRDLHGMFAIALWDTRRRTLLLARDRFGEKPLYYTMHKGTLLFGSELKALIAHPLFHKELDPISLEQYLFHEYIPTPRTIFKNVEKLPAGQYFLATSEKKEIKEYWNIIDENKKSKIKNQKISEREAITLLNEKLDAAVKKMLVADVPLGVFLSGGLDSSTIAYYAQKNSSVPIKTFSIGFSEKSFDESAYAEEVAELLGTTHVPRLVTAHDLMSALPNLYTRLDEPLADPSFLPTSLLAEHARSCVTVALGGDGSDELFMGYRTFQAEHFAQWYMQTPRLLRTSIKKLIAALPTSFSYMSTDFLLKQFIWYAEYPPLIRDELWRSAFNPFESAALLRQIKKTGDSHDAITKLSEIKSSFDIYQKMSYLYLTRYLQDDILAKVDRASMHHSLEVRVPFLDPSLAEFVFALPTSYKLRGFTQKYLLKKLMAPRLGKKITYRKKQGFQPPIARWLNHELAPLARELLDKERLRREGIFNPDYVASLLAEHRDRVADNRKKLWTLLVFQMWRRQWLL